MGRLVCGWGFSPESVGASESHRPPAKRATLATLLVGLALASLVLATTPAEAALAYLDKIQFSLNTSGAAVSHDGRNLYIALASPSGPGTGELAIVDLASGNRTQVWVGTYARGVAVSPDGSRVYLSGGSVDSRVFVVDTATKSVVARVNVGSYPIQMLVTPNNQRVYVSNFYANTISVIDAPTFQVVATVPVESFPYALVAMPDGQSVYVANSYWGGFGSISIINTSNNTVVQRIAGLDRCPGVPGMALSVDGSRLYVPNTDSGSICVVDTSLNQVVQKIAVGPNDGRWNEIYDAVLSKDQKQLYVADARNRGIAVVDLSTGTVIQTLMLGMIPLDLELSPDGTRLYATHSNEQCVSVIDTGAALPDRPPVANAGSDPTVEQTSAAGTLVTLDGSGSSDPDGDVLTYAWTWPGGAATGVNPTVTLPLGTTTVTLVVNDSQADSDPDTVLITVRDTTPPTIQSAGSPTLTNGLLGYWQFDGDPRDWSGNARDLTLQGGLGYASGLYGGALDFHGDTTQYAIREIPDTVFDFGSGDFTVQVWANLNTTAPGSGEQVLIEKLSGAQAPGWSIYSSPGWFPEFAAYPYWHGTQGQVTPGTWHHILVRRQGQSVNVLLDGVTVDTVALPPGYSIPASTRPLLIGRRNSGDWLTPSFFPVNGRLDEIAIWNRSLTADECATLYNSGQGRQIAATCDITVEQSDGNGTQVTLPSPPVGDICDASPVLTNDASPLSPLGTTIVTWTAIDASGNVATATQKVTVVDTTPPVLVAPKDMAAEQTSRDGTVVALGKAAAIDVCDAAVVVTNDAPAVFPLGETTVTWTATDASGNSASATQKVTITDTTAPGIESVWATPNVLWSPNHKIVDIAIGAVVGDICDAAPAWKITGVASNEPVNGLGDGDTAPDWEVTGDHSLRLRAERSGKGSGRVYTITIEAADASGNASTATCTVSVPHDQKKPGGK